MAEPRRAPYLWVTWLAASLSGDDHCAWKPWFKARFSYLARPEDDAAANRLARWKADHAEAVRARADLLRAGGWAVSLEDQNKFTVKGRLATVGGVADIVAFRPSDASRGIALGGAGRLFDADARIEDIKTGQRRESDFWQLVVYLALVPMAEGRLRDQDAAGAVIYKDGIREITHDEAGAERPRVLARIREIATMPEPPRTPSPRECRFCNIAECPDRAIDDAAALVDTEEF